MRAAGSSLSQTNQHQLPSASTTSSFVTIRCPKPAQHTSRCANPPQAIPNHYNPTQPIPRHQGRRKNAIVPPPPTRIYQDIPQPRYPKPPRCTLRYPIFANRREAPRGCPHLLANPPLRPPTPRCPKLSQCIQRIPTLQQPSQCISRCTSHPLLVNQCTLTPSNPPQWISARADTHAPQHPNRFQCSLTYLKVSQTTPMHPKLPSPQPIHLQRNALQACPTTASTAAIHQK